MIRRPTLSEFCKDLRIEDLGVDANGTYICRGTVRLNADEVWARLPLVFVRGTVRDRRCWASEEHLAVVEFAEGDVSVSVFWSEQAFREKLAEKREIYRSEQAAPAIRRPARIR